MTVKDAVAKSPAGLPVSSTVYVTPVVAVGATVKVPVKSTKGPDVVKVNAGEPENSAPPAPVAVRTPDVSAGPGGPLPLKPTPDTETLSP
jgi:hypothetical protein